MTSKTGQMSIHAVSRFWKP